MTRRIVVPVDKSMRAQKALDLALEEFPDANITALHVIETVVDVYDIEETDEDVLAAKKRDAEEILDEAVEIAAKQNYTIDTEMRVGKPANEIVEYAAETETDWIIIGSHGRSGLSRILIGSVAESVARRAPIPVMIVR